MKVRIVNKSAYPTPAYATEKSAGMDLKADIQEPVVLNPLERALIPTGFYLALPDGTEAQVRPRSGLAAKFGIQSIPTLVVMRGGKVVTSAVGARDEAGILALVDAK